VLRTRLERTLTRPTRIRTASAAATPEDDWPGFLRLTAVVIVRSVLFFGLTSFLSLYFLNSLHTSKAYAGATLSAFLISGACGTLLGGALADRYGRLPVIRLGFAAAVPGLLGLVLSHSPLPAAAFVLITGVAVFLPFSVFVALGQDYLPHRIGTASGVTVGLAVSVGGLFSPLLGALADATTLRTTLSVLIALPMFALALTALMHEPGPLPGDQQRRLTVPG
jgi:FSR family fosmidomycin resistance protein-like MFS transporter